jgi:hypothetical protein
VPVQSNFLLELNYAYLAPKGGLRRDYFLVDVVDFTRIHDFMDSLRIEADEAVILLTAH